MANFILLQKKVTTLYVNVAFLKENKYSSIAHIQLRFRLPNKIIYTDICQPFQLPQINHTDFSRSKRGKSLSSGSFINMAIGEFFCKRLVVTLTDVSTVSHRGRLLQS